MSISFKGFNEQVLTFNTSAELDAGTLVKMNGSGTVAPCASGDKIMGVVLACRNNIASVQVGGYISLPYSGTAPTPGYCGICAADSTKIKTDNSAGKLLAVLETDTTASVAGILL